MVLLVPFIISIVISGLRERNRSQSIGTGPETYQGKTERCLTCHWQDGPPGAHSADALGCVSCHLGDPLSFDKTRAHKGMEKEPGKLETVDMTCGQANCHPLEANRVKSSLMATGRGIIGVDKWAFGEIISPDTELTLLELLNISSPTRAESHLQKLCSGCHLYSTRNNRDDGIITGGSGCSACHFKESKNHIVTSSEVSDSQCFGCHSRSGRISLSYQGLVEIKSSDKCDLPSMIEDGRRVCQFTSDIHFERGISCIDCHLHTDLMGDGVSYAHKEEQVEITCESCHGPTKEKEEVLWALVDNKDKITTSILSQKEIKYDPLSKVRLGKKGTPIWNLRPSSEGWRLYSKNTTQKKNSSLPYSYPITKTPQDPTHKLLGHERLTCTACHSTWAPICSDCHMDYKPLSGQWDFSRSRQTLGQWREHAESFGWGPPALAVEHEDRIVPAIPGMIMNIDLSPGKRIKQRLYAAISPHTIRKKARSCSSCHCSSFALGLGTGSLIYTDKSIQFTSASPNTERPDNKGLAYDRWTTLDAIVPGIGTRSGLRSFNYQELKIILRVGRCLMCHGQADDPIYIDFRLSLENQSEECKVSE